MKIPTKGIDNRGGTFDVTLAKDSSGKWIVNVGMREWYLTTIADVRGSLALDAGAGLAWTNAGECIAEALRATNAIVDAE